MDIKQIKENKIRMILQFSIPSIIAMLLQTVITITDRLHQKTDSANGIP